MMVVMVLVVEMMMMMMMMMMMIPMKSSLMAETMAMISPLREGISPADFSPTESFSLSGVFLHVEAAEYFLDDSPCLRVPGDEVREGGLPVVRQGSHTLWRRGQGGPVPPPGVGPWWPTSGCPSGSLRLLMK